MIVGICYSQINKNINNINIMLIDIRECYLQYKYKRNIYNNSIISKRMDNNQKYTYTHHVQILHVHGKFPLFVPWWLLTTTD